MILAQMKLNFYSFLSDWLCVLVVAAGFFLMGATFGGRAIVGLQHNLQLGDVVTWYGRGNGSIQQYYLSTLIIYSTLWLLGGVVILFAKWLYNRRCREAQESME